MPVYETSIYLFCDREEAHQFQLVNSAEPDDFDQWANYSGFSHEVVDKTGKVAHFLAVFDGSRNTAIHEATHMAQEKMKHLNLPQRRRADETLAYFVAWISEQMLDYMDEQKKASEEA